ncbi:hypothetical protein E2C01_016379 [Portunus trituberculatus]|uniref:Uncharacterized protein n=1 Tax=Portunus trituberculatus TaxID=210409 RepID=A0A5B7DQ41_PORTR|nr:hypothetical protein [Portunus trituberculatus]
MTPPLATLVSMDTTTESLKSPLPLPQKMQWVSPSMSTSHCRVHFPKGHGKTLAQCYDWFMALLKQHPLLEPVIKEGRCWPYLTVNPQAEAYAMLVKEGFLGLTMIPADPDARKQMVIIHGMSTVINVGLLDTPKAFLWLKRRVVAGEPRPQLLGLIEGPVPSSVYLHGYCSWGHPSSRCLEKIHAGTRVLPLCCNCGGDHNATSRRCRARPRPVREPQTTSTATGPSRVVFRLDPPPQHNVWTNGPSSWSAFTAQPSAFPPQPGTAAPGQPRVAQPSVPSTLPPVPVPPRDASASALWTPPAIHESIAARHGNLKVLILVGVPFVDTRGAPQGAVLNLTKPNLAAVTAAIILIIILLHLHLHIVTHDGIAGFPYTALLELVADGLKAAEEDARPT